MKAPGFWYRPAGFLSSLLSPLGNLYRAAGIIRAASIVPYTAKVPVICVGNITAGGAGKTPVALALARLLQYDGHNPAFISRGYGGSETGPLRVDLARHTFRDVGDEPLLLARTAPCWIGRDRAAAVREAEQEASHLILDDGLQNPSVVKTVSLLVVDGAAGIGNGALIPAGPLRETLDDVMERVEAVVMIGEDILNVAPRFDKPVLRAKLLPYIRDDFPDMRPFLAFAGIGRPEKFYASCRKVGLKLAETRDFPDHHVFRESELSALAARADEMNLQLLTTEKDWVRLPEGFRARATALPVELAFENSSEVRKIVLGRL